MGRAERSNRNAQDKRRDELKPKPKPDREATRSDAVTSRWWQEFLERMKAERRRKEGER
jgi:hypothetical protein